MTHASLVEIMKIAASEALSSNARKRKGWFREKEDKLVKSTTKLRLLSTLQINLILLVNTSLFNTSVGCSTTESEAYCQGS